jgi:hypothetical protein
MAKDILQYLGLDDLELKVTEMNVVTNGSRKRGH